MKLGSKYAWINNQQDWPDVYGLPRTDMFGVFGTTWYQGLDLPGVKDFVARYQKANPDATIKTPGNVFYNGYWATRSLFEAVERAKTTNNHAVIKELEQVKIPAVIRMQHHDAYMNPKTQLQQTIYLATANLDSNDPDELFKILSNTAPIKSSTKTPTPSASSSLSRPPQSTSLKLLPHLINGIALGVLFGLLALGFMLIVGVMEVINLAHGSLFALGAYVAMEIVNPGWLSGPNEGYRGLPLSLRYGLALLLAPIVIGVVGMGLERLVRRTYGKKAEYGLLLTFGAALVLEEGIRIVWGKGEQNMPVPESVNGSFVVGDLVYSKYRFFASALGIVFMGLTWAFLEKTP